MSFGSGEAEMATLIQTLLDHDTEKRNEGIIIIDSQGNILNINNIGRKLLRLEIDQVKNRNISEFLDKDSRLLQRFVDGENIVDEEEKILADHCEQSYLISMQPVLNRNTNKATQAVLWLNQGSKINRSVTQRAGVIAKFQFKDIIGESWRLQEAIAATEMFADSDENILLVGESGTGKELFAQAIHNHRCPNGPFIAINCAALPRELVESELFGYEGGSFTGAERSGRCGKFELAEGGTLFLDEIGDMSLSLQATLLRVLEDKQIIRIGGHRYKKVDFTIVAATNKDLSQMVEDKLFREDLYYRLSVFPVNIPPLRDREMDSRILSHYFIERYCWKKGRKPLKLSRAVEQKILEYDWPGNVRQLHNAMIFAINKTKGDTINIENMPSYITSKKNTFSRSNENQLLSHSNLKEMEKVAIESAMEKTKYKVSLAAQILGTNKSTLYRKLQEYGIQYKIS